MEKLNQLSKALATVSTREGYSESTRESCFFIVDLMRVATALAIEELKLDPQTDKSMFIDTTFSIFNSILDRNDFISGLKEHYPSENKNEESQILEDFIQE